MPRLVNVRPGIIEGLERRVLLSGGYSLQQLAQLTPGGANPSGPAGQLVRDSGGNLFGIATAGGANGTGAVFEVPAGGGAPVTVASFPAGSSPLNPSGLVEDSGGNLFGFTQTGGDANNDGTIFEVAKGSNTIQTVAQFNAATTGSHPGGNLVVDSSDDVFGLTSAGGATGGGTVWALPAGTTTISALSLPTINVGGVAQQPGVGGLGIDAAGNIFGTMTGKAADGVNGTLWELVKGANSIQTLATFAGGTFGSTPVGALAVDKNDFVYGVTSDGGSGSGTVWQFQPSVGIAPLDTLGGPAGGPPVGGVVLDSNGNVFGATSAGGGDSGTAMGGVWELHAHSTDLSVVQSFSGTDGATPNGGLITDRFGDVYGTTSTGGANGGGTVFELDLGNASSSSVALSATVSKTTLPANVVVGKGVRGAGTVRVDNTSNAAVRGVFTVGLYASPDGAIDDSAVKIGSKTLSFNLPAGKSKTLAVPVSGFTAAAAGDYSILGQVSDASGGTGATATGPTITSAAPFVALSEVFSKVKLAQPLVAGQATRGAVSVKVNNGGNVASHGKTTVSLMASPNGAVDDAVQLATLTRNVTIAAGKSALLSVNLTSIPAGLEGSEILIALVTDPNGAVTSANYANPITVTSA